MNTQTKLTYAWLVIGLIFAAMGVLSLLAGSIGGIFTLAIAGLIMFQSIHNMGGWEAFNRDVKKQFRLLGK